jgi:hypothetical protein
MIFIQLSEQLQSLSNLLLLLNDKQYNQKNDLLGNASIGGHTRHIIELLKCATDGYHSGVVDYVNRSRNLSIETDKTVAMQELGWLLEHLERNDKEMKLVTDGENGDGSNFVSTTFFREIVYNAEHTIHHLALIRVALRVMKLDVVGDDFGMAYSTIKYLSATNKK